jgi:hypothetical protein
MSARPALPTACVALLVLSAFTGADYVSPSAAAEPVGAPPVHAPAAAPTLTPSPQATPAPTAAAASEATPAPQATPAPAPEAATAPEATPAPQATPAPAPEAATAPEATPAPQAMPAPAPEAATAPEATPAPQAMPAATPTAAVQATQPPPGTLGPGPPSGCATPYEFWDGDECRAPSDLCGVLGMDDDDLLTGTLLDDILCGFVGDDQDEGDDGDDVPPDDDRDDLPDGDEGDDCVVRGPGPDNPPDTTPEDPEPPADNVPTPPSDVSPQPTPGTVAPVPHESDVLPDAVVPTGTPPPVPPGEPEGGSYGSPPPVQGGVLPLTRVQRGPAGAVPVAGIASVAASGGVSLRLSCRGPFVVRRGWVRLCVPCSANAPAELVLVASSRRIAHKRFLCRAPGRTVRVRLNVAGRRLVARERRVRVRQLVLVAGGAISSSVVLFSSRG